MRRFQTVLPAVVVLSAALALLIVGPIAAQRIVSARTSAVVTLAQQRLDEDDILERINAATRAVAETIEPSVVYIEASMRGPGGRFVRSNGSGWVYSKDGFVVTNAHVVAGMDSIGVQLTDGRLRRAQLIGFDPSTDIAVLKTSASGMIPARRATDQALFQGDRVFAFGSPFGFKFSMSEGIVSGLGRHAATGQRGINAYTNYIQTDAAINPGNSGGPLVDVNGRVVGMNTAIVTTPERSTNGASEVTGLSGGIGFAIPLQTIEVVVEQLLKNGEVLKGFLGVALQDPNDLPAEARLEAGLTDGLGVLVTGVTDGLPAARAGIRPMDVIVAVDGKETPNSPVLRAEISNRTPGEWVTITVRRADDERDLRVRLGAARFIPQTGELVPVLNRDAPGNTEPAPSRNRPF